MSDPFGSIFGDDWPQSSRASRARKPRQFPDLGALPADAMLVRSQVAELSGYSLQSLKVWARRGRGPRVSTVEGRPRYRVADVRAWLQGSAA